MSHCHASQCIQRFSESCGESHKWISLHNHHTDFFLLFSIHWLECRELQGSHSFMFESLSVLNPGSLAPEPHVSPLDHHLSHWTWSCLFSSSRTYKRANCKIVKGRNWTMDLNMYISVTLPLRHRMETFDFVFSHQWSSSRHLRGQIVKMLKVGIDPWTLICPYLYVFAFKPLN